MTIAGGRTPGLTRSERGAAVPPIPPPLYFAAAFALGVLLRGVGPSLTIGAGQESRLVGAVLVIAGVGLCLAAIAAVARHHTTIVPHHPVSTLLTTGAYRISRNPMYSGLAIVYLGAALLVGSWWPLATLPIALVLVWRLVIRPEERYLASHFGRTYLTYQVRARRWL